MLLYFRLWEGERSCQKAASYLSLSVDTEWTAQNSQDGTEWVHFCRHAWASQVPGAKSSSTRQWEPTQALGHLPFALHSTDWWPCLLCSTLTNSNVLLDQVWHSLKSICFSIRSGLGSFRRQRPPNQGIPHCTPPHTHTLSLSPEFTASSASDDQTYKFRFQIPRHNYLLRFWPQQMDPVCWGRAWPQQGERGSHFISPRPCPTVSLWVLEVEEVFLWIQGASWCHLPCLTCVFHNQQEPRRRFILWRKTQTSSK